MNDSTTKTALEQAFQTPVSGASFRKPTRIVAIVVTILVLLFIAVLWIQRQTLDSNTLFLFLGAGSAMCVSCWHITQGRTTISSEGIHQDGLVGAKNYSWDDIKRARLLKLPMATRLIINTGRPPFKSVYAGTPELATAFAQISQQYGNKLGP